MELQDFAGNWRVERSIEDRLAGGTARFEGKARWVREEGGLSYHETGQLVTSGQSFTAERRYFWREGLNVYFDDGRFFHQVPAQGGAAAHWCDPDQYDVAYDFLGWPDWHAVWSVKGPRKDYTMVTRYMR